MEKEKSYGVTHQNNSSNALEIAIEEIEILGYTIIKDALTLDELTIARQKIDSIYKEQENNFGVDMLQKINEKYIARCPLIYEDFFLNIATNTKTLEVVEAILGNYYVLHLQNGIINMPNQEHHQSSWHRDLPYQNFTISKPLALSALFCIDEFNAETGATFVVPFSHKIETIPSSHYINTNKVQVHANAGSVILFDAMLFHKAGFNQSQIIRRGINNVYTLPILKQQINLPAALNGKYSDDVFLSKFLGYQSDTPLSVDDYRLNRLTKLK